MASLPLPLPLLAGVAAAETTTTLQSVEVRAICVPAAQCASVKKSTRIGWLGKVCSSYVRWNAVTWVVVLSVGFSQTHWQTSHKQIKQTNKQKKKRVTVRLTTRPSSAGASERRAHVALSGALITMGVENRPSS